MLTYLGHIWCLSKYEEVSIYLEKSTRVGVDFFFGYLIQIFLCILGLMKDNQVFIWTNQLSIALSNSKSRKYLNIKYSKDFTLPHNALELFANNKMNTYRMPFYTFTRVNCFWFNFSFLLWWWFGIICQTVINKIPKPSSAEWSDFALENRTAFTIIS